MKATLKLYSPHEAQLQFHQSPARFRVASFGRQSGKSTACLNELLKKAWERPNSTLWFVSPTYDQARVQYRRLVGMLYPCQEVLLKKNQSELRIKLINQSQVRFVSGETLQNLRGETLHGVVVDEVRDQHPNLWSEILRPMLTTTKGWACFVSTPRGFDSFFDLFEKAKSDGDWESFQAPSTCNPLFTQDEYEAAKKELSEAVFDQEINANFRDIHNGTAYVNFGPQNVVTKNPFVPSPHPSPYLPILVGMDFNLSPMCWVLGQERAGDFYFFDEIYLEKSHTQEAALELAARIKRIQCEANPRVILVGDATGKAGQRAAMGRSDLSIVEEILTEAGIRYENRTPESNPLVSDRVNVVNSKLKDATGMPHIFIHKDGCPKLLRDFQRVVWKAGASALPKLDQSTDPTLSHMSDGCGYLICRLSRMWVPSAGGIRVLPRQF